MSKEKETEAPKVTPGNKLVAENQDKIEEWKQHHKKVKVVTFHSVLLKKEVPFILGKPTASIMDAVSTYDKQNKTNKVEEVLIKNCVKAGDVSVLSDDIDVKNELMGTLFDMFEKLQKEEKEL